MSEIKPGQRWVHTKAQWAGHAIEVVSQRTDGCWRVRRLHAAKQSMDVMGAEHLRDNYRLVEGAENDRT